MLYDNGQLISLYAEAYQQQPLPLYKRIVEETIIWAKREMLAPNKGFYSALDADSEGVEGKFYTFDLSEIKTILGDDADLFIAYFNITAEGNWEEEKINILNCDIDADLMAQQAGYTSEEWEAYLHSIKKKLFDYRKKRIHPGLDHKQLATWNALLLKGLIDAYRVFDKQDYLKLALENAEFLMQELIAEDFTMLHQPKDSNRSIPGFLDDYAFTIAAFTALYEATFEEKWLYTAKGLLDKTVELFYDSHEKTFYYSASNAEKLIARKSEVMDNVIPSSTSTICHQLKKIGLLLDNEGYISISDQLFANVFPQIKTYGSAYSNWAILLLEELYGCNEIALTGEDAQAFRKELDHYYIPNKIVLGGTKGSLPLLLNREGLKSKAYLCRNKTCSVPQNTIAELIKIIE
ncbi:hypothetical protein D3C86_1234570 [compost metagenome]